MKGYLLVFRKLVESQIWQLNQPFDWRSAWVDLLLHTAFCPMRYRAIELRTGEFACSPRELCDRWQWSEANFNAFLRFLRDAGMVRYNIIIGADGRILKLAVINWAEYQPTQEKDEKKRSKRKGEKEENKFNENEFGVTFHRTSTTTDLDKQITDSYKENEFIEQEFKEKEFLNKSYKENEVTNIGEVEQKDEGFSRVELDLSTFTPGMRKAYEQFKRRVQNVER